MTVDGNIYDSTNSAILGGASVEIVTPQGSPTGEGVEADNMGYFTITSPLLDQGDKLLISFVGYTSVVVDPSAIVSQGYITLEPSADTLATATVTAPAKKKNYTPILAAAGIGMLLLAIPGKKKKHPARVGDAGGEVLEIGLLAGVAAGAYFLVLKPIFQKLGLTPDQNQVATTDAQKQALAAAQATAQKTGAAAATYTQDQYAGFANQIFTIATSTSGGVPAGNQDQIVDLVIQANTLVDLQSLIVAFGQRKAKCLIFGLDCTTYDLPSFLRASLDQDHINQINSYLDDQGINYQF